MRMARITLAHLMLVSTSLVLMASAIPMPAALSAAEIGGWRGKGGGGSDGSNVPEQVHLTQGKHPGSLIIGWATQGKGMPVVRYGLKSGAYEWKVVGTTETYVRGNYTSPSIHHAKVRRGCNWRAGSANVLPIGAPPACTPDGPRMGQVPLLFATTCVGDLLNFPCGSQVSGLSPSTTYYYAIGDEVSGARELYFTTLPVVGGTQSLTFTVIG